MPWNLSLTAAAVVDAATEGTGVLFWIFYELRLRSVGHIPCDSSISLQGGLIAWPTATPRRSLLKGRPSIVLKLHAAAFENTPRFFG